ncbi:DUF3108 domain-containing protein [Massilia sp. IC2-477]|uniref:DUF3108 domain-containing protein n=1 Tax=Massilia sp. IC2-477 TaxID=2887198 RepID=UPI001D11E6F1|nr:DUF3108 domain-containing protein [Massilia sp. IC2-477]MCC2957737.1 DUF3108 domain-containing protein [Massilia sp. IC2-477]
MQGFTRHTTGGLLLALALGAASAQEAPAAVKRAIELPPSADLNYELQARQRGFGLKGEAIVSWRAGDGKYSVSAVSKVPVLGTITDDRSHGTVDAYGLAPAEFVEKRMRKDPTTASFDRDAKALSFSESKQVYPLKGGEQDRVSITWQLATVARGAGDRFKAGSEWPFFVAGRRDAETWVFKVVKREKVRTGLGEVDAVLVARQPLSDKKDQTLEVWLAPQHEWYPVKLRYTDGDKEQIEQTLNTVTKR